MSLNARDMSKRQWVNKMREELCSEEHKGLKFFGKRLCDDNRVIYHIDFAVNTSTGQWGASVCLPQDLYDKEYGRVVAASRLLSRQYGEKNPNLTGMVDPSRRKGFVFTLLNDLANKKVHSKLRQHIEKTLEDERNKEVTPEVATGQGG